jgi:hypothetical protein
LNNSAVRFCVEPTLMVPTLTVPGFAFVGFQKIAERLERRRGADHEHAGEIADGRDRHEILERVVRQMIEQGDGDGGAVGQQNERVTVLAAGQSRARRGDAGSARIVLDDEILAELVAERLEDETGRDVGNAARPERQYDAHRPARIFGLRPHRRSADSGRRGRQRECRLAAGQSQFFEYVVHTVNLMGRRWQGAGFAPALVVCRGARTPVDSCTRPRFYLRVSLPLYESRTAQVPP